MKANLFRRINKLERSIPAKTPAAVEAPFDPVADIIERLRDWGYERRPKESWLEVTARAMGVTAQEWKKELERRAEGWWLD